MVVILYKVKVELNKSSTTYLLQLTERLWAEPGRRASNWFPRLLQPSRKSSRIEPQAEMSRARNSEPSRAKLSPELRWVEPRAEPGLEQSWAGHRAKPSRVLESGAEKRTMSWAEQQCRVEMSRAPSQAEPNIRIGKSGATLTKSVANFTDINFDRPGIGKLLRTQSQYCGCKIKHWGCNCNPTKEDIVSSLAVSQNGKLETSQTVGTGLTDISGRMLRHRDMP